MPALSWAKPAQLAWLRGRLGVFAVAQNKKTLRTFWEDTYRDFFKLFPTLAAEKELPDTAEDANSLKKKKKRRNNNAPKLPEIDLSHEAWVQTRKNVSILLACPQS